mgnify:CR=1 FL=1
MTKPRYLVCVDPLIKIQPKFDTSLRLTEELLSRGIEVDWLDLSKTDTSLPSERYLAELPVQNVLECEPENSLFISVGPVERRPITDYAVILQRKDPPVDDAFRAYARHFAAAPKSILQINDPTAATSYSEHLLPMEFPELSIPTQLCRSFEETLRAVRASRPEAVLKPVHECSGIGVTFLKPDAPEAEVRAYWERWAPEVVVQPYQEEITKSGDLRILVMNRRVLGSVLRVPRAGSRLANLHQGASSAAWTPTPRQLEASRLIADRLTPKGLYLLGLDFIGDVVSEINITSPSALVQINLVQNSRIQVDLVDEIEKLRQSRTA